MNIYNELYGSFPRQIGIPYRIDCITKNDFYTNINKYYKYKRVYASIYNYINNPAYIKNMLMVDKIFFDFDGLTHDVYNEVASFIHNLTQDGIKHLPLFTGGGFHVYVWTGNHADLDSKKGTLFSAHKHFETEYHLKHIDPAVIGDIARVAAVPNTYNFKRGSFCIPLTHDRFNNMTLGELAPTQEPINQKFIIGTKLFDIGEFNTTEIEYGEIRYEDIPFDSKDDTLTIDNIVLPKCIENLLLEGQKKYIGTSKRLTIIVYLRDNGVPYGNIKDILKQHLTTRRNGVIEWQHCFQEKQIEFIYSKGMQYSFPDCDVMKMRNQCNIDGYCDFTQQYHNGKRVLKIYK